MGLEGIQVQSHGVVAGLVQPMAILFVTLIPTVMTHQVVAGATSAPCSTTTLACLHGVQALGSAMALAHVLLPRSCTSGAARLVVLGTEHILHSWEKGAVLVLEEGVREADGCEGHEAVALLTLIRFVHRADGVELVLLTTLLVQLTGLRRHLLRVGLRLGMGRGRGRGYVVWVGLGMGVVWVGLWVLLLLLRVML